MTLQPGSIYGGIAQLGAAAKTTAVIPWYLAGGISAANCLAAYQPKGAASYAVSKVNLASPGTRNLSDGATPPNWDATNGWTAGAGASLLMGNWVFDTAHDYSWICLLEVDMSKESGFPISTPYNHAITVQTRINNFQTIYRDTQKGHTLYGTQSGVFAVTRYGAYKNGVALSTYTAAQPNATRAVSIIWNATSGAQLDIKAWALYQVDITTLYLPALTTAMNLL